MPKPRNTYDIIYYDILRVDKLYEEGLLHNKTSLTKHIFFRQDISKIVNDIDNSVDWYNDRLRELRETVEDKLEKRDAEVENSKINIFHTAGDMEDFLQKNFIRPVFLGLDPKDKTVEQILLHDGKGISQLEQSCKDKFDPIGKSKKKQKSPEYLEKRREIQLSKGFVQLFPLKYSSNKGSIISRDTPPNLRQLALVGRSKFFGSGVEKIIRKTSEYITKELHYNQVDKESLGPMEKDIIKNDPIGLKGILAHPALTNKKNKTEAIRSGLKAYCNRHGLNYEEKYKAIGPVGYGEVQNIENADAIYIDGKGNRLYEFEGQITDALRNTIIEIAGERSHALNKERMQRGLTEDFFHNEEGARKLLQEADSIGCSRDNIKQRMSSTYNKVYNILYDRFCDFMKQVQKEYGTSSSESLPPFLQFKYENYFANLPRE